MSERDFKTAIELLEKPVDVKQLVKRLFFNPDELESAAVEQPKYYLEAGKFRARSMMKVSYLKRKLARVVSEETKRFRGKGVSATEIKGSVQGNKNVLKYQKRLDTADALFEFTGDLREAYKERAMIIGNLTKLRASEMGSELRQVKNSEDVDSMRKRANKARQRFNELNGGDEDE